MRVIFGQSERSGTIFTIVRSGTVERAPASYASRRIEWVQPQFGSGARRAPRYMAKPPRLAPRMGPRCEGFY